MPESAIPYRRPDLLRLDYDTYRALPAIANSDLSRLRDALDGRPPRPQSSSNEGALSFGTAFHTALLEPDDYVAGQPGLNDTLVWWLVEGVKLNSHLAELLTLGISETSVLFTEPETDTLCKLRADLIVDHPDQPFTIIDFKTTMARDADHFLWQCSAYDYDRQAAFYTDALRAERFLLVGVQKVEPFGVFTIEVSEQMLAEGRQKYHRLLRLLKAPATAPAYRAEAVQAAVDLLGLPSSEEAD
ncbi:PD-(D/E)XK nuclease-like domain-containing protein [Hymenobacter sp. BT770]|uniref:PD-(D/E)XK nuclease-like domain-containing protein n=1 Tax=Hymenobacter sp. BT770 TaxID=2886942 RepID=UPI001D0F8529|nr:PD-(D/E)XK nuclease-like domain-containing protein [Hymenobacter sp. BT770]MCC3152013.1 PD-(D/E)XK nuclease-like domain-containing protein [Hymenobacter sp. BT770]MDO3415304.1 PD-(D/E)XK nuclease-like domain-containing protein [Hymenobacter sp. BT770]